MQSRRRLEMLFMRIELGIPDVDAALLETIEKSMNHFGPTFKAVVFHELKTSYHIDPKSIVSKPIIFSEFLDSLFSVGANAIRKVIVQEIGFRFSVSTKNEDMISMINKVRRSTN